MLFDFEVVERIEYDGEPKRNEQLSVKAADTAQQSEQATPHRRRSSLRESIRDGKAYAVSIGFGETYFGPFAVFLGASTLFIGTRATLPPLLGGVFQGVSVWLTERFRRRRAIVSIAAYLHALTLAAMALIPLVIHTPQASSVAVFVIASCYFLLAGCIAPPWSSLIGDLVPARRRGRFFGLRTKYVAIYAFASVVAGGTLLDLFHRLHLESYGFVAVFLIAAVARGISAHALSHHADIAYEPAPESRFTFWQFIRRAPRSNFAKFVFFYAGINCAVAVAGPYFAVYMLRELELPYIEFMIIVASATVPQFLTVRYWGVLNDRFGSKQILNTCAYGVSVVPFLWFFSPNPFYLCIVQAYSGIVWSGYNLAAQNFMFDAVSPPKRARCMAYQNVVNGGFVFLGSMLGGGLATVLPKVIERFDTQHLAPSPFLLLFGISGCLRLVCAGYFLSRFHEVRAQVAPKSAYPLVFRVTHFRPIVGAMFGIVAGGYKRRSKRLGDKPMEH
ncbi:MAG: MFS transporter [Bdellovibrionales bacterium]|nr:MFS transporter [Bdellovibrionales bacterium]